MDDAGINWSDIGRIENGEKPDESKYTEDDLQQFGQARHAEGDRRGAQA